MKILIDARMYGLENTGIGRYLVNLIEELRLMGRDQDYVILLRKKYFDLLNLPENWHKIMADFRHYTFEEQILLPGIIKKENPDLVHFPHFNIPVFWNGKFVVTIHDMSMHRQGINATKLPLPIYLFKRMPYKITFLKAVNQAVHIIVPSGFVKKEIVDYFDVDSEKVSVIYEGIGNRFFKKPSEAVLKKYNLDGDYFIYVGALYPHKNTNILIDAISKLNEAKNAAVKLVIVSPRTAFAEEFENKVTNKNASAFVKYLRFVPDEDLPALYKFSLGFIYPSLSEGFGLQGLETMAAGSLLLASDIDVFKEVYGNFAYYFDPLNLYSLVSLMNYVLRLDNVKRKSLINKARKFVKKYSWRKMAVETLAVYKAAGK